MLLASQGVGGQAEKESRGLIEKDPKLRVPKIK